MCFYLQSFLRCPLPVGFRVLHVLHPNHRQMGGHLFFWRILTHFCGMSRVAFFFFCWVDSIRWFVCCSCLLIRQKQEGYWYSCLNPWRENKQTYFLKCCAVFFKAPECENQGQKIWSWYPLLWVLFALDNHEVGRNQQSYLTESGHRRFGRGEFGCLQAAPAKMRPNSWL